MIKENENRLPKTGASSSTSDADKQSHDQLEERGDARADTDGIKKVTHP